jgi:hypothetical protein
MTDRPWFYLYKSRGSAGSFRGEGGWVLTLLRDRDGRARFADGGDAESWVLWIMFPWMAISLIVFLRLAWTHSETIPVDEAWICGGRSAAGTAP